MFFDMMQRARKKGRKQQHLADEEGRALNAGDNITSGAEIEGTSDISSTTSNLSGPLNTEGAVKPAGALAAGIPDKDPLPDSVAEKILGKGLGIENEEKEATVFTSETSNLAPQQQGVQKDVQGIIKEGIQDSAQPMSTDPYAAYKARQELRLAAKDPEESLAGALSDLNKTSLEGAGANPADEEARKKRSQWGKGVNSFFGSRF
jgi:hypothetical protein